MSMISENTSRRPVLPLEYSQVSIDSLHYKLTLFAQEELLYFDGHFDKAPILPGVVQVHWAEHYSRQLFRIEGEFSHLEVIKFQKVIPAKSELLLDISYSPEKNKVSFSYVSSIGQHSSGRIAYQGKQV